jgi:hypothetical protein
MVVIPSHHGATLRVLAPGNVFKNTNVTFAQVDHAIAQVAGARGAWRSQAARFAASSSCVMIGDLAGMPLFMTAPCSHFEQTRTRGSDAAVTPTWPQMGQAIRVNMSGSLARSAGVDA